MLVLFTLLGVAYGAQCKDENNVMGNVNPDCNWAGRCVDNECYCCDLDPKTLMPELVDGIPDCPGWMGGNYFNDKTGCIGRNEYVTGRMHYYFPAASPFSCDNAAQVATVLNFTRTFYLEQEFFGIIELDICRECTPSKPCKYKVKTNTAIEYDLVEGFDIIMGSDFNTYYDPECAQADKFPINYLEGQCEDNLDHGYHAALAFNRARKYNPDDPNGWNNEDQTSDLLALNDRTGLGATDSLFDVNINIKADSIRTRFPTAAPSPAPTADICFTKGYTNKLTDLKYMGNGLDCRAGIPMPSLAKKGGRTCDSPYIVCLPEENTPNQLPKNPAFGKNHLYTIDDCKYECTWDQRCRGFEFVAKNGGKTGDCNLIDDLPLEITSPGSYVYDEADSDLDQYGALCFQKQDYCNPFFRADQLEQTMIDCYCPNNRKGFYTKKVKRTVANTKFCQDDAATTERIKQAQANRMFHLCENWCLFNTFYPEEESWYWNPWKKCWREQYAGTGTHRSYCNRVIRNPDTIEQYFINYRTENFCAPFSKPPKPIDPLGAPTTWYLAAEEESCDDACEGRGLKCHDGVTASMGDSTSQSDMDAAFNEAGITCTSYGTARKFYAAPVLRMKGNQCQKRNASTQARTGCQWPTGVGYKRLCACY